MLDRDGYPTEETLDKIEKWDAITTPSLLELLEYVQRCWSYPEYFTRTGRTFRISTGGWSGNEDLIGAMQANAMFWALCWQSSKRGGHYVFRVPTIKDK